MHQLLERWVGRVGAENESDRVAWVRSVLLDLPAGARILDAGAGERRYKPFCEHLEYVSQDFAQYVPGTSSAGFHPETWDNTGLDIVSDILSIPAPDGSFDAVLCTEVLEHVPYPTEALKELTRLLRPGGMLILTAPFCSLTHFAPYHFHTGFSRFYYERVLNDLGLDVVEITPNGNYFEFLAQEARRIPLVASRYAGGRPARPTLLLIVILLRLLHSLTRRDTGSHELLTYGFHVRAFLR